MRTPAERALHEERVDPLIVLDAHCFERTDRPEAESLIQFDRTGSPGLGNHCEWLHFHHFHNLNRAEFKTWTSFAIQRVSSTSPLKFSNSGFAFQNRTAD